MSAGAQLRELMKQKCVMMPGAFNGMCARLVRDAGFEAAYVSGAGVSASRGLPDIGVVSLDTFASAIREVTVVSNLPVIADADTGFGEEEMVTRTVREYHHAGAAGLHLEDQVFPKRCGHLDGKTLVPVEQFAQKVRRAAQARDACDPGFIVCARTDAYHVEGFDAAVARATAYVEAGADMIFPEGLDSLEKFETFAARMRELPNGGPLLLANMTEFGKTPHIPLADFEKAGYNCVIYPVSALRVAMRAMAGMLSTLKETGTLSSEEPNMFTRKETYTALGYTPGAEWVYPAANPNAK